MSVLQQELKRLEGILGQDPETGKKTGQSYLGSYTNRLFGAPFQLMDSVDGRYPDVNSNLGAGYLRHFMLNSPILHIKPGLPKYTGNIDETGLMQSLKSIYMDTTLGGMNTIQSMMSTMAATTLFGKGATLRRRMFGFRETYYDYMQHVNYMCHSVAIMMELTTGQEYPNGVVTSEGTASLADVKWENYRMMGTTVSSPAEQLSAMVGSALDGPINALGNAANAVQDGVAGAVSMLSQLTGSGGKESLLSQMSSALNDMGDVWSGIQEQTMSGVLSGKISTVQFMVEPVQFEETFENQVGSSAIADTIESLGSTIGNEIAWISQSNVTSDMVDSALEFMGNSLESVINLTSQLTNGLDGGFVGGLFGGALSTLKGQKMLYPEIYKGSTTGLNYNYTVNLVSPYGDPYNYYINIVVPLIHLICLVAPRMVTANSFSSPYLVQSYIPGMTSCQLGMVTQMTISKNPDGKHVSVHGYPLSVKVTFTIKELYQNLSISPANDPSSFLFNETLNDYLSNLAGLIPSLDTYETQRQIGMDSMKDYFTQGMWANDFANMALEKIEDHSNAFVGR